MRTMQNPARDGHWASSSFPVFLAGILLSTNYTIHVGGRIVGRVEGTVFVKKLKASRHFLHIPPAIAFDIKSLHQAEQAGARWVKVIDLESGKTYQAPISLIFSKGFPVNRGFGDQLGLGIEYFTRGDDPMGAQLSLWGEI